MNKEESLDATLGRLEKIRQKVHRKLEANFKILLQNNRLRTISELECEEVIRFMEFLKQAVVCEMTVKNGTKDMQYLLEEFDFEPFLSIDDSEEDDEGPLPDTIDSELVHDNIIKDSRTLKTIMDNNSEEGVCSSCPIPNNAFDLEALNNCSITIGTDHMIKLPKGVKGNESAQRKRSLILGGNKSS